MKSPKKELKERRVKALVQPRKDNLDLPELKPFCTDQNTGTCYRRNRSIESEDDILF